MEKRRFYLSLGVLLILSSIALYGIQLLVFKNPRDTFFYFFQDVAFVPIQVLLVMLIIDKLLQKKEKELLLNKLNMVVGVFFNEVGTELIALCVERTKNRDSLQSALSIDGSFDDRAYKEKKGFVRSFGFELAIDAGFLKRLDTLLRGKHHELISLLENPNLLEHDGITDLLWAVFHLSNELYHRNNFKRLPASDIEHLRGDLMRAYKLLLIEWLNYMMHLKSNYPYLFSIALRINPLRDMREAAVR